MEDSLFIMINKIAILKLKIAIINVYYDTNAIEWFLTFINYLNQNLWILK